MKAVLARLDEQVNATRDRTYHSKEAIRKSRELIERTFTLQAGMKACQKEDCVMKACSCGKKYLPSEWFSLPLVGYQDIETMGGEMRNCECNSTMLVITRRREQT